MKGVVGMLGVMMVQKLVVVFEVVIKESWLWEIVELLINEIVMVYGDFCQYLCQLQMVILFDMLVVYFEVCVELLDELCGLFDEGVVSVQEFVCLQVVILCGMLGVYFLVFEWMVMSFDFEVVFVLFW